ncbi:RsmD family RNA methyltransferase [uncultured Tenacibaculum sp.]|uniref:THUMP-like domain-containing protein n=1 Tax=uncultured Tenacibaculum sp. TaxID=174713 RepID=UPI00260D65AD|nr:RsmD family RNA methyltransferase [uncultured Tenacibaculum sp.]
MNKAILQPNVQLFIQNNLKTDINKLIFKGSPFENITIQELANQILAKQKSEKKLPQWFNTKDIYYPEKLSIEQTSSEITAEYKSNLISGDTIIDLTGGFGVDCLAFSKIFKNVIHCEINEQLSKIVKYNYEKLGVNNIKTIAKNGIDFLKQFNGKLDCIYIDPSRRHDVKGKVFLLKDCLPNVPENLDFLFTKANTILIKNSPILDITSTINDLKFIKEIHIISVKNEVKELLFILEKNYKESIQVKTHNLLKNNNQEFNFTYKNNNESIYSIPQNYLYEPNAAILKSGGFNEVSYQLKINKLQQHSHLYTSEKLIANFPGRIFKINNIHSYNKKKIKKTLKLDKANISIRNFPKTVAQIRTETKIKDGGETYLFFTKNINNELIIIECSKN